MLIEFRASNSYVGGAYERRSLGGPRVEYAATQEGFAKRMEDLGAPVEFAARAAARHVRSLANPRANHAPESVVNKDCNKAFALVYGDRIAAAQAAVAADRAAGKI